MLKVAAIDNILATFPQFLRSNQEDGLQNTFDFMGSNKQFNPMVSSNIQRNKIDQVMKK